MITIYGLNEEARLQLIADLGQNWIKEMRESDYRECHDFVLNPDIILKANNGRITLDLGGNLAFIEYNQYVEVSII